MTLVLATGGLGFIGSHTCVSLIENGFDVLILDSLENSSEDIFYKIQEITNHKINVNCGKLFFINCDISDEIYLEEIFHDFYKNKNPIESVIHFAGLKSVEESVRDPLKYWDINLRCTINLLRVMRKYECNKLVFSSSATIYKPLKSKLLKESFLLDPINPYGRTKLTIEKILFDFQSSYKNFKFINLRYFNPVGAHSSGIIGENPRINSSNLFPVIGKVIRGELEKLSIFGKDWPTIDGTCIRDYIHVMDLADAHISALKFIAKSKPKFSSINIGTGEGKTVLEVINTYSKVNHIEIPYSFEERREGDTPFLVADNRMALKILNWKPSRTFDQICIDSFNFINKN